MVTMSPVGVSKLQPALSPFLYGPQTKMAGTFLKDYENKEEYVTDLHVAYKV